MVEILISSPPSGEDMRDGLVTLPSLGQAAGVHTTLHFVSRWCIYNTELYPLSSVKLINKI